MTKTQLKQVSRIRGPLRSCIYKKRMTEEDAMKAWLNWGNYKKQLYICPACMYIHIGRKSRRKS